MRQDKPYNPDADVMPLPETTSVLRLKSMKALRRKAEEKVRGNIARIPENLENLSRDEIQQAFFELRVHQIELEMQNQELLQTQAELENERARYFDLYDLAPVGYCILSREGLILEANLTATTMLGVPQGHLVNQPITRFILAAHQDAFYLHRQHIFQTGTPQVCELQMVQQDGETVWVQLATTVARGNDQTKVCRVVISTIAERKRVEQALQQSEEQAKDAQMLLQLVLDTIPVRLFWKDLQSVYLGCNRLFAQDAGREDPEELIGSDDDSLGWNERTEMCHRDDIEVMASGTPRLHYEQMHITHDGKQTWFSMSKVPLRDANNKIIGVLGVYEDVTQRKWVDEELLKVQKIESLGLLAGGIAHDFNNILMVIMGNISFAKMMLSPSEEAYARLGVAETASLRAKTLTQQFLTFSSGGTPVKRAFSIAKMIRACGQFALSGAESTCAYSIASDLWDIDADENQIGQVLTNILINADQSMQNGGVIKIACENVLVREEHNLPLPNGRFVKIDIKDQGIGIPGKDLSSIFDPYFTTKEAGRGLGLAAAYSIIKKHGGHITVESNTHTGATFSLYLPAAAVQAQPVTTVEDGECIVGKGKVLVMDDDDMVLQVVGTMLSHLGYQVELAVNGEEALAKYSNAQQLNQPFNAVIMDLLVPGGMGGEEAIGKLLAIDPQAKAIVSSGYCYDPVMADYKNYGFKGVIAKPYHLAGLSEQLQQLMHN